MYKTITHGTPPPPPPPLRILPKTESARTTVFKHWCLRFSYFIYKSLKYPPFSNCSVLSYWMHLVHKNISNSAIRQTSRRFEESQLENVSSKSRKNSCDSFVFPCPGKITPASTAIWNRDFKYLINADKLWFTKFIIFC